MDRHSKIYKKKIKKYNDICAYEHQSLEFILSLKPDGLKINSSDLNNPLMLEKISKLNIPINLSVGSSTTKEICYAVTIF